MMHILVAIPTNPHTPPALRQQSAALVHAMARANPGLTLDVWVDDSPVIIPADSPKYTRHAIARNRMLDVYLKPAHDAVLWIDADLIAYPPELPSLLMETDPFMENITAPIVTLDHAPDRFYDIGGFIEQGRRAHLYPPWFDQAGPIYELESVGCCYLAPAALYRAGVRYAPPADTTYVEHWSVMREARARGIRIVALGGVRAVHAWLPDYGLAVSEG